MKHEPVKDHSERKRISALIERCEKEQTMRLIDADDVLEFLDLMYDDREDKDDPYNVGVMGAINYIKHKAPTIKTKQVKYYDEDESVWKIGEVIVDE